MTGGGGGGGWEQVWLESERHDNDGDDLGYHDRDGGPRVRPLTSEGNVILKQKCLLTEMKRWRGKEDLQSQKKTRIPTAPLDMPEIPGSLVGTHAQNDYVNRPRKLLG